MQQSQRGADRQPELRAGAEADVLGDSIVYRQLDTGRPAESLAQEPRCAECPLGRGAGGLHVVGGTGANGRGDAVQSQSEAAEPAPKTTVHIDKPEMQPSGCCDPYLP